MDDGDGCSLNGQNDLHARVLVLEGNDKRHEKDIEKLWKEATSLKLCAQSLPGIESDLREISKEVKFLNECKVAQEWEEKGKMSFWVNYKEFIQIFLSVILSAGMTVMLFKAGLKP